MNATGRRHAEQTSPVSRGRVNGTGASMLMIGRHPGRGKADTSTVCASFSLITNSVRPGRRLAGRQRSGPEGAGVRGIAKTVSAGPSLPGQGGRSVSPSFARTKVESYTIGTFVARGFPGGGDLWRRTQSVELKGLREHEAYAGRKEYEAYVGRRGHKVSVGRRARGGRLAQSDVVERLASPEPKGLVVYKARISGMTSSTKWRPISMTFIASFKSK